MAGATFAFTGRRCIRCAAISGNLELHDVLLLFLLTTSLETLHSYLIPISQFKKFILSQYIYNCVDRCLLRSIDIILQFSSVLSLASVSHLPLGFFLLL
jgi:hypothetical protein